MIKKDFRVFDPLKVFDVKKGYIVTSTTNDNSIAEMATTAIAIATINITTSRGGGALMKLMNFIDFWKSQITEFHRFLKLMDFQRWSKIGEF